MKWLQWWSSWQPALLLPLQQQLAAAALKAHSMLEQQQRLSQPALHVPVLLAGNKRVMLGCQAGAAAAASGGCVKGAAAATAAAAAVATCRSYGSTGCARGMSRQLQAAAAALRRCSARLPFTGISLWSSTGFSVIPVA
jgi:hypothetical protein